MLKSTFLNTEMNNNIRVHGVVPLEYLSYIHNLKYKVDT